MSELTLPAIVLDALSEGVYFLDTHHRIQLWNQGATAITGFPADRVLGRACADGLLNHVDEEGRLLCGARCPLRGVMVDGQERQARVYLHHADGRLIPVLVRSRPVRDEAGVVVGAVESFRDDTDHSTVTRRMAELEALAMLDPLTGVGNRRYMDAVLAERFDEHRRTGAPFAVLLLDLDHFKAVNDTFGHDTGDVVLRTVAGLLTSTVRRDEAVTRFGGEEFLIVVGPMTETELVGLAERMIRLVGQIQHQADAVRFTVTASIGATIVRADDTTGTILHRADQALLTAKRSGRNRSSLS